MWYGNISVKSKRLHNIVWHKFEVDWYWEQVKYKIKLLRYYESNY